MTKVDLGETHFTIRRTASGLWIELIGPEGHAEINVSERLVRNNLKLFGKISLGARIVPGSAIFRTYAEMLEKAIKEELAKPPQ